MAGRFNFISPGVAVADEIQRVLADREAQRRQAFLESIQKRAADRNDEVQRMNAESLKSQRDATITKGKQDMAAGVAKFLKPGQSVDDDTASTLNEGNLGILIQQKSKMGERATSGGELGDALGLQGQMPTMGTERTFAGTPEQIDAQKHRAAIEQFINDPSTPEPLKRALQYELATGEKAPAGAFDKTPTSKTAAVQEYEYYVEQEKAAGRTPISFNEYQAMDANRKRPPSPVMTAAGFTEKETGRFLQIAGAADRSPLIRANDRTITLDGAIEKVRKNPADPAQQMKLAYGFIQALDTYQSAVREGELQLIQSLMTRYEQLKVEANRIYNNGAFVSPEAILKIADAAKEMTDDIRKGKAQKMKEYRARARVAGVGAMWEDYLKDMQAEDEPAEAPAPQQPAAKPDAAALRKQYGY